jgi:molybdate transport system substrate-binding protein
MGMRSVVSRALLTLSVLMFLSCAAPAAEIKVMISGGFSAALERLVPQFERTTGHTVMTIFGASMGNTPEAIPSRLQRGEPGDVVIMVGYALADLIKQGKVVADSRVDLARSSIGVAVRAGAPKPDISSVDALRSALVAAKSIAYSDSASGVYISTEMFERLGIKDRVAGKSRMIPGEPVGTVIARGDAEIGFQQISELHPIAGIDLVGPLPPELQKITVYSASIAVGAKQPEAARALVAYVVGEAAMATVLETGLEPTTPANRR